MTRYRHMRAQIKNVDDLAVLGRAGLMVERHRLAALIEARRDTIDHLRDQIRWLQDGSTAVELEMALQVDASA